MKYIIIYEINNKIIGEYITKRYSLIFLKKYRGYIFKINKDILYIKYPIANYYKNDKINDITDNHKDQIDERCDYLEIDLSSIIK
jgi:hypothetical protein